jgi:hypothetical protein
MKKKQLVKRGLVQCPCCKAHVTKSKRNDMLAFYTKANLLDYGPLSGVWACDVCLASGNTIKAKITAQVFGEFDTPHHAYFNRDRECKDCKTPFTFHRGEQQFWFETLQFRVYSSPTRCKRCRKNRHAEIAQNNRLMVLNTKAQKTSADWQELAAIYENIGATEKANAAHNKYKQLLKNKKE